MDTTHEEQLRQQLWIAVDNNRTLADALVEARLEVATLAAQLAVVRATADDLAALVCRLIGVLRAIRPMVGNGAKVAIDAVMVGVETPNGGDDGQ